MNEKEADVRHHHSVVPCFILVAILAVGSLKEVRAQLPLPSQIPPNLFTTVQGRGMGEVPLNQVFYPNFTNAIGVKISGGLLYRTAFGCGVGPDAPCQVESFPFTSADQRPSATATICKSLGAQSIYVLVATGGNYQFYIADVCGNPLNPPNPADNTQQRLLLNWTGVTYSTVQSKDPAAGYNTPGNVVRVVHASIYAAPLGSNGTTMYQLTGMPGATYLGAGTISVNQGQVLSLDNCSGHFKPPDAYLTFAATILNVNQIWVLNNPLYSILLPSIQTNGTAAEANCKSLSAKPSVSSVISVATQKRQGPL
jgi:hypothetical protein